MACRSAKRFLIVTGKIKCTLIFEALFEGPLNQIKKFFSFMNFLISKFNVGLKSLLQQGLSETEFYGDLVYKFKNIRGMTDFSDLFRKIIMRYKRIGYNLNVMRQSACSVINPIAVDGYATLFNCTRQTP